MSLFTKFVVVYTIRRCLQNSSLFTKFVVVYTQHDIRELERTREAMAREMVNLSNLNQEQSDRLQEFEDLKKRYKDLDQRYNALLQMYGEKVEEAQELRLDLSDIKDLYKTQVGTIIDSS